MRLYQSAPTAGGARNREAGLCDGANLQSVCELITAAVFTRRHQERCFIPAFRQPAAKQQKEGSKAEVWQGEGRQGHEGGKAGVCVCVCV